MNLVQILLNAKKPLSLVEIVQEVPGYPPGKEAYRGAFERDKRTLREEGIEIDMVEIGGEAQQGYRINPDRYYLPELNLTAAMVAALTIYDMCKNVDRTMRIEHAQLVEKSGGRSGTWRRDLDLFDGDA